MDSSFAAVPEVAELTREQWAHRAIEFVRSIGISVTTTKGDEYADAFVPHIRIEAGGLMVNPEKVFPGEILHECVRTSCCHAG